MSESVLYLPEPFDYQAEDLSVPKRFKLLCWGRRRGKSRTEVLATIIGHGPGPVEAPTFPGIMQGGHGAWVAPDYPQARAIWREEFVPRFAELGAEINRSEHRIDVPGLGSLRMVSAENIDSLRGSKLDFIVCDEAAHFDLEYAWASVIRPALADRRGWAMFGSTPNVGEDGNADKRVPSYFNMLCEQYQDEQLSDEWFMSNRPTRGNPAIPEEEIEALYAMYPPGSATREQELEASLRATGVGLALTMLDESVHLTDRAKVPQHWPLYGTFDWGYDHPWVFQLWTCDEDGTEYVVDAITGRHDIPDQIAQQIVAFVGQGIHRLQFVVAGTDCWADKGKALGIDGPTIAETLYGYGLTLIKAKTAKVQGLNRMRRMLYHDDDVSPQVLFFPTEGARRVFKALQRLRLDPKNPEEPLKVDANSDTGLGGDDDADAFRYGCMARFQAATPLPRAVDEDTLTEARLRQQARVNRRPVRGPDPERLPSALPWAAAPSTPLFKPPIPGMDPEDARSAATFTLAGAE